MGETGEVEVVEVSPMTVIGIRKQGRYREIKTLIETVFSHVSEKGIPIAGPPFYLSHESTQEESRKANREGTANLEVAVPVFVPVEGNGEITCYAIEGGKMAKVMHKGPYHECGAAFEKLHAWLEDNGAAVTGPMREVYLNSPEEVSSKELLTEVYAPID
jgi:effector-binding domain-containing protein